MNNSLRDLAGDLPAELAANAEGDMSISVTAITHDSREVTPGSLFVALKGDRADGHDFIPQALARGAAALVVSEELPEPVAVPVIRLSNTRRALPYLASAFYGKPSNNFGLSGVTGTNGKTTVTYMLSSIFRAAGRKTGVIGTVGVEIDGKPVETHWSVSTTPESTELQALFSRMWSEGVGEAIMEVSSHALDQERTACCAFDTAIFTNLTQDHLDYHRTMAGYRAAKEKLFTEYPHRFGKPRFAAILNAADETGRAFAESCAALGVPVWTYGAPGATIEAADVAVSPAGTTFSVREKGGARSFKVSLAIGGLFNVQNALAAVGAARSRGIAIEDIQAGLANLAAVPGRFELVPTPDKPFHVLVDYAHTPDGLDNLLKSARALRPERLVCVFGCGGNRDRTKRPIMGRMASEMADIAIVTSDNPRKEEPGEIIREILGGIEGGASNPKVRVESDRRLAIRMAVTEVARPGDLVVIAGKGHETYQIVGETIHPFDDRLVVREELGYDPTPGNSRSGKGGDDGSEAAR